MNNYSNRQCLNVSGASMIAQGRLQQNTNRNNATSSFHDLAILLVGRQPSDIRYTHLMGWIQELHHSITAISVNRDQLQELIIPRLLSWSKDQDHFRATLQLFNISEDIIKEILLHSSAVTAHATRMIRVLETHQMVHFMNKRKVLVTTEDEQYRLDSAVSLPPTWSDDPTSYLQTLRWWRDNFSSALMTKTTEEYLRVSAVNRHLQEETQRPARHSNQRTTITIPRLPRYRSGPRTYTPWSREKKVRRRQRFYYNSSSSLEGPPSRPEDADTLVAAERRAAPRSRFPTRTPKRPTGTWVEFCAFCDGRDHYTSDCPSFPYLSSRACKAEKAGICSNCVKSHYGVCIRRDPCTICKEEGHHRAFCVQNPWVALDITMSA
ncbi:hypothetical protein COOONC_05265 [Cooperia oncophora]